MVNRAEVLGGAPYANETSEGLSQTRVFQELNNVTGRTRVRQLAVDHDCRNGSNAQLLGACENPTVQRTLHDDFARRTRLSPHCVNYLIAERASRAEHFDLSLEGHCPQLSMKDALVIHVAELSF
jgi:hypothetical protein